MFRIVRTLLFGGLVGKALAIFRELVTAWLFGTGVIATSYRLSQTAFLIPFNGFLSDSLTGGYMPLFAQLRKKSDESAQLLFSAMQIVLVAVSVAVALALFLGAESWIDVLAPGLGESAKSIATHMVEVLSFGVPFYVLSSLYSASELASGDGRMFAARAAIQSVGLVLGAVVAWWLDQPSWIPVGFVLSYIALTAWGLVIHQRAARFWLSRSEWRETRASLSIVWRRFTVLMWMPILLQIHFIVERRVASIVNPSAIAALDYARFVVDTAVTLFALPFGMAALGSMSQAGPEEFSNSAYRSMRALLYLGVPIAVVLTNHTSLIVEIVFGRGAFGEESKLVTSAVLGGLATGLWCQLVAYAGIKFLNARGQNHSALLAIAVGVFINVIVNVLLYQWLGIRVLGIAFALNSLATAAIVVYKLGLFRAIAADLSGLGCAALAYSLLWHEVSRLQVPGVVPVLYALVFWSCMFMFVPSHKAVFNDVRRSLRRMSNP